MDHHPAIREALVGMIKACEALALAGEVCTVDEAFAAVKSQSPDVVVVDFSLPDGHGLDFIQNLVSVYPTVGIVVYTAYDEGIYAERALRAGARGYVMKTEPSHVVGEAIQKVARGEVHVSATMASRMLVKSVSENPEGIGSRDELLTDREITVLQLLGEGASADEIAALLHLSRKTVETHRRHIKEKLELDSVSELLVFAVRWVDA